MVKEVSIHAPARGATAIPVDVTDEECFNPRTRTGCDGYPEAAKPAELGFNPRTRTGCDEDGCGAPRVNAVSIHAPARGATRPGEFARSPSEFQSTHPHGVRRGSVIGFDAPSSFNPRTRTGCDAAVTMRLMTSWVSIHAPARGATMARRHGLNVFVVSIHAPARGATVYRADPFSVQVFQSTHPHGVRLAQLGDGRFVVEFQSTHPHGVRPDIPCLKVQYLVSIHAPARGATI